MWNNKKQQKIVFPYVKLTNVIKRVIGYHRDTVVILDVILNISFLWTDLGRIIIGRYSVLIFIAVRRCYILVIGTKYSKYN